MCVHICFGVELHDVDSYKLTWRQCGNCVACISILGWWLVLCITSLREKQ